MHKRLRSFGLYTIRPHGGEKPWWSLHEHGMSEITRSYYKPSIFVVAERVFKNLPLLNPEEFRKCKVNRFPTRSLFHYYSEVYLGGGYKWLNGGVFPEAPRCVTALLPGGVGKVPYYVGEPPLEVLPEISPEDNRTIYREEFGPLNFLAKPNKWPKKSFNSSGNFDPEWVEDARNACRILLKYGKDCDPQISYLKDGVSYLRDLSSILSDRYGGDWGTNLTRS